MMARNTSNAVCMFAIDGRTSTFKARCSATTELQASYEKGAATFFGSTVSLVRGHLCSIDGAHGSHQTISRHEETDA